MSHNFPLLRDEIYFEKKKTLKVGGWVKCRHVTRRHNNSFCSLNTGSNTYTYTIKSLENQRWKCSVCYCLAISKIHCTNTIVKHHWEREL